MAEDAFDSWSEATCPASRLLGVAQRLDLGGAAGNPSRFQGVVKTRLAMPSQSELAWLAHA